MKRILFVIVVACALLVAPGIAQAYDQVDEIAWKTGTGDNWYTFVGDVYTTLNGDMLTVEYVARPGYMFAETHLAVAETVEAIPHRNGGPVPGRFPYGMEHAPLVGTQTYSVDVSGMDLPVVIVAHAVVVRLSDCTRETGWATGCTSPTWAYPGSNWARYFMFPRP